MKTTIFLGNKFVYTKCEREHAVVRLVSAAVCSTSVHAQLAQVKNENCEKQNSPKIPTIVKMHAHVAAKIVAAFG